MELLLVGLRLVLAGVFAVAGVAKLNDRRGFDRALEDFGVPRGLARPLGIGVPVAELGVAAALVLPRTAWWAGIVAVAMLLVFMALIGRSLALGRTPDCNCFGRLSAARIGRKTLARNVLLSAIGGTIVLAGPSRVTSSAVGWVGALTPAGQIGLAGAVVVGALLASQGWLLMQVMRQNGRMLDRITVLEATVRGGGAGRTELPLLPSANGANGHRHHAEPGLPNGHTAPKVRLADLDGTEVDLADFTGRITALVFWNPSCGFCQQMLPSLKAWAAGRPDNAPELLVIAAGSVADNRALGLPTPVLLDTNSATAREFGATGTPQAVLIGPDGRIASPLARGGGAVSKLLSTRVSTT
jgi:uncharacterized membrane protein YphA (DoxX/SURF4 family)/thiol-disulfide isomerase/thioredoxin